jgi:hypothetical protein
VVGFADPVFDPAERAKTLAERRPDPRRRDPGLRRLLAASGHQSGGARQYLPSLLDTADELNAVAGKLGAAAGDLHLGSNASEVTV